MPKLDSYDLVFRPKLQVFGYNENIAEDKNIVLNALADNFQLLAKQGLYPSGN